MSWRCDGRWGHCVRTHTCDSHNSVEPRDNYNWRQPPGEPNPHQLIDDLPSTWGLCSPWCACAVQPTLASSLALVRRQCRSKTYFPFLFCGCTTCRVPTALHMTLRVECSPFTIYQASAFVGTVRTASGCQADQSRSLRVQQNLVTWHAPGRMGSWHMQPRLQPNAQLIRECAVTALRGPPRRLQCYRAALQKKMLGLPAHVRPRWEQALAARRRWRYAFQLAFPSAWEWRLAMTPSGIRLSRSRGDRPSRLRFPPHTQSGGGAREAGPGCQPGQVA